MDNLIYQINQRANTPKDIDYSDSIERGFIQTSSYEISRIKGQVCYPIRNIDLEETCNAYILENGNVIGNLNSLYGLNELCFTDILGGEHIVLTKDFEDVIYLKDNKFAAVGLVNEGITSRQYEELLRVIGLKLIYIILDPNIDNRILT